MDGTTFKNDAAVAGTTGSPAAPSGAWKLHLLRGVLAVSLGIVAILFPVSALFAFTLVFAAYVLADGILALFAGLDGCQAERAAGRRWSYILYGILGVVVGAIVLAWPFLATVAYAVATLGVVIAWAVAGGVFEVRAGLWARRQSERGWVLTLLSGVISVVLGLALTLLFMLEPAATLVSVAWLIGTYALLYGIVLVALGILARRVAGTAQSGKEEAFPRPSKDRHWDTQSLVENAEYQRKLADGLGVETAPSRKARSERTDNETETASPASEWSRRLNKIVNIFNIREIIDSFARK